MGVEIGAHEPTVAGLTRQPGRARPEWKVKLLTGISEIKQADRLDEQRSCRVRPEHDPEPAAQHFPSERRTARGVDMPERELVIAELDLRLRRAVSEAIAWIRALHTGAGGAQADAELLADEQHLPRSADRVRPGERDSAGPGAAPLVSGGGEASHQPAVGQRPGQHHRNES